MMWGWQLNAAAALTTKQYENYAAPVVVWRTVPLVFSSVIVVDVAIMIMLLLGKHQLLP